LLVPDRRWANQV